MTALTSKDLNDAIVNHAALRRIQRLQPVGGVGDKLFPPTYPKPRNAPQDTPPRHIFERRRVEGDELWCVLLDSVQSQANRLEEALLQCTEQDGLALPHVTVDFSGKGLEPLEKITSLDAPHRIYDAILRDSLLGGTPFMQSDAGKRLAAAKPQDATALLEYSPTALTFGAWHSQGEGGGIGAKFPRTLVSEIMGVNTPVDEIPDTRTGELHPRTSGRRTGSRIDPLGILKRVPVYKGAAGEWDTSKEKAGKGAKEVRPSKINHGNIPPTVEPLGVTCAYAEHRVVITLAGIRRLRFGGGERDNAGRALVAAIGLVAVTEQDAKGYALRSRCDLVCDDVAPLELVQADGSVKGVELTRKSARELYQAAYKAAESAGFKFKSLSLAPQEKLVEIIRQSQELALESKGGEEDENEPDS